MPRIPLITPESDLTGEQKRVVEGILGRRGGRIPGPYRFSLRLSELAIVITARMWDCDYVFQAHAKNGVDNGLPQPVVDALARNERPVFEKEDEEAIYDYLMELYEKHAISDKTHARAKELFGVPGIVELTALSGYYGMVAMTLLAHEMPLPEGVKPPLKPRR